MINPQSYLGPDNALLREIEVAETSENVYSLTIDAGCVKGALSDVTAPKVPSRLVWLAFKKVPVQLLGKEFRAINGIHRFR